MDGGFFARDHNTGRQSRPDRPNFDLEEEQLIRRNEELEMQLQSRLRPDDMRPMRTPSPIRRQRREELRRERQELTRKLNNVSGLDEGSGDFLRKREILYGQESGSRILDDRDANRMPRFELVEKKTTERNFAGNPPGDGYLDDRRVELNRRVRSPVSESRGNLASSSRITAFNSPINEFDADKGDPKPDDSPPVTQRERERQRREKDKEDYERRAQQRREWEEEDRQKREVDRINREQRERKLREEEKKIPAHLKKFDLIGSIIKQGSKQDRAGRDARRQRDGESKSDKALAEGTGSVKVNLDTSLLPDVTRSVAEPATRVCNSCNFIYNSLMGHECHVESAARNTETRVGTQIGHQEKYDPFEAEAGEDKRDVKGVGYLLDQIKCQRRLDLQMFDQMETFRIETDVQAEAMSAILKLLLDSLFDYKLKQTPYPIKKALEDEGILDTRLNL